MDLNPQIVEIPEQLLKSREIRWQYKLGLTNKGVHLVSLQLNIPGYPKTTEIFSCFLNLIKKQFEIFLKSQALGLIWEEEFFTDAAGECVIYRISEKIVTAQKLKELTEIFEENHELGRIVDADVLDSNGVVISSGKQKSCILCKDKPVVWCRKYNYHTPSEIREYMQKVIEKYLVQEKLDHIVSKLTGFVVSALLHEVSLTPKPGLVSRTSSGGHRDMDFSTFMGSIGVLAPYFMKVGMLAGRFKSHDVSLALPEIREIGLEMEDVMFETTHGINTHKGGIFLMSIALFAAVRVIMKKGSFKTGNFASVVQQIARGITQRELCGLHIDEALLSHGQICFLKYGLQGAGARGEVEQGMPTVLHHALPELSNRMEDAVLELNDNKMKQVLVPVLLKIMTVNNDTNVLYRHGKDVLQQVKQRAADVLGNWNKGSEAEYYDFVEWCTSNRISSGGSADLLSVTLFVFECKKAFSGR